MSTLTDSAIQKPSFVLDANPKYDFSYKSSDVYMLQNVAEDVNYQVTATNSTGLRNLSFTIKNPSLFFDRGVSLNIEPIELIMKRKTTPDAEPTADNYITGFFDKYQSLAYRQFGFLNAIDSIKVNLDGTIFTVNNVADMLKICSCYYDESVVNDKIDASLPDLMDYDNYLASDKQVKTVSESGAEFSCRPSISNAYSPFGTMGTNDYNTRQPALIFKGVPDGAWGTGGTDDERRKIHVATTGFQCFIPFTIFAIPGDVIPLAGVKAIELTINLHTNWEKRLFSSTSIESVDLNTKNFNAVKASLNWRSFTPPEYIAKEAINVNKYAVGFPTVEMSNNIREINFRTTENTVAVPSLEYDLRAIPKAVYIAAKLKQDGSNTTIGTADVYARIDSVNIELCGKKTQTFDNSSGVYSLAKNNGLNLSKECMYLSGFPLKIVTTNDLGAKSNSLVGSVNNQSNRLNLTNIKLTNVARKGNDATYEIRVIVVYDGLLDYDHGKWTVYESLISAASQELSADLHASALYNGQINSMNNVIGGSIGTIFSSMIPYVKKAAKGAFNIGKQAFTNKDFRNALMHAANGNRVEWNKPETTGSGYAVTGGSLSSHSPIFGGGRNFQEY